MTIPTSPPQCRSASVRSRRLEDFGEVDAVPPVLVAAMGLDETSSGVVVEVLGHGHSGAEANFVQTPRSGLVLGEFQESSSNSAVPRLANDRHIVREEAVVVGYEDKNPDDRLAELGDPHPRLCDQGRMVRGHGSPKEAQSGDVLLVRSPHEGRNGVDLARLREPDGDAVPRRRGVTACGHGVCVVGWISRRRPGRRWGTSKEHTRCRAISGADTFAARAHLSTFFSSSVSLTEW